MQPLDVSINKPIKEAYKNQWIQWINESTPSYTQMGNRQRASYQAIVNMVSNAMQKINKTSILSSSFGHCGLVPVTSILDFFDKLNPRLKSILCPDQSKFIGVSDLLCDVLLGTKLCEDYTKQMSFDNNGPNLMAAQSPERLVSVAPTPLVSVKRRPRPLSF